MKSGKYEPYRNADALKTKEVNRRAQWFKYDPYSKQKTNAKPLEVYTPELNPLIHKEPIRMLQSEPIDSEHVNQKPLIINFLLHLFQPFFKKISFGISQATQSILNKFKRHK